MSASTLGALRSSCTTMSPGATCTHPTPDPVSGATQPVVQRHFAAHQARTDQMEFTQYVRKPFIVEAVEVTVENMAEVAKYVGEMREKDDGTPFIYVDRRLVPNVFRVYPGFYMTRMGDHIRCYSRKVFLEQFVPSHPDVVAWVEFINNGDGKTQTPKGVTT